MDAGYVAAAAKVPGQNKHITEKQSFSKGSFTLNTVGDTYFDLGNYSKGMVYINGHNLGRYWNTGPQQHLYCPAGWLKKGSNEIIVFDLLQTEAKEIKGVKTPE